MGEPAAIEKRDGVQSPDIILRKTDALAEPQAAEVDTHTFFDYSEVPGANGFMENLPPGDPTRQLSNIDDNAIKGITGLVLDSPLDYFRMMQRLSPHDRVRAVGATKLHDLVWKISTAHHEEMAQFSIAQAAVGAWGEKNVLRFALKLTDPSHISRADDREAHAASMILAQGLPLRDLPPLFAQFGNLPRTNIHTITRPFEMLEFFKLGIHSLAVAAERDLDEHPATLEDAHAAYEEAKQTRSGYRSALSDHGPTFPPETIQRSELLNKIIKEGNLEGFLQRYREVKRTDLNIPNIYPGEDQLIEETLGDINFLRRHMTTNIVGNGSSMRTNELDRIMRIELRYRWNAETKTYVPLQTDTTPRFPGPTDEEEKNNMPTTNSFNSNT